VKPLLDLRREVIHVSWFLSGLFSHTVHQKAMQRLPKFDLLVCIF